MALLIRCIHCNVEFLGSSYGSSLCDNCNGTNEDRIKEKERWNNLSDSAKIEELLERVKALENRPYYPHLIG